MDCLRWQEVMAGRCEGSASCFFFLMWQRLPYMGPLGFFLLSATPLCTHDIERVALVLPVASPLFFFFFRRAASSVSLMGPLPPCGQSARCSTGPHPRAPVYSSAVFTRSLRALSPCLLFLQRRAHCSAAPLFPAKAQRVCCGFSGLVANLFYISNLVHHWDDPPFEASSLGNEIIHGQRWLMRNSLKAPNRPGLLFLPESPLPDSTISPL
ncbi:hypothetical protein NDU88_001634 [Pleurodeles waltl]|uniref:Transmembrane protein n=1 Tax=Pleurodeles waltl TaxID=8319 RepID=A0AAV7SZW5_PLEWA|nr:hypothetical protein NDU88_001634 [Pleurodeles waltl]